MNPETIIKKYYDPRSLAFDVLVRHSTMVAEKAVSIARKLHHSHPDIQFISEAVMLHDIGIYLTNEPALGCHGHKPYICHGYLGREILERERLFKHALVCERHVGVGITIEEIKVKHLPLPERDMEPVSLEEQIICYADTFFSKASEKTKTLEEVRDQIHGYGAHKAKRLDKWAVLFGS